MRGTSSTYAAIAMCLGFSGASSAFAPAERGSALVPTALNARDDAGNYVRVATFSAGDPFSPEKIAGVVAPTGFFDPLGFASKADEATVKRYREAELTHGRVAMLASVGFLVGEKVEGSSFLFDAQVSGPAISHLTQIPPAFWAILILTIGASEQFRAKKGWVDPSQNPIDKPGQLEKAYVPGDLGFDPLGLMPANEEEIIVMQTKELQHGRLAMLATAGMMAQELVDQKGIVEHFLA